MRISRRLQLVAAVAFALVVVGGVVAAATGFGSGLTDGQRHVAERGGRVMPFELDATTHIFTPTADGGVQDVVADDPNDAEQIQLVREHLRAEAEAFRRGDFDDPAEIHGGEMPGLAELSRGYKDIEVRYEDRADGARLTYSTHNVALVDALHRWFHAQLSDHGQHAEQGRDH